MSRRQMIKKKKNIMGLVFVVLFGVICTGCNAKYIGNSIVSTNMTNASEEAAAFVASIKAKLNGWWVSSPEIAGKYGCDRYIYHGLEDGSGVFYLEVSNGGSYYIDAEITSISEDDIKITGTMTDASNHFYLTTDSDGEDILVSKDIAYEDHGNNREYIQIMFRRCDESIIEGKNYVHMTQAGNWS